MKADLLLSPTWPGNLSLHALGGKSAGWVLAYRGGWFMQAGDDLGDWPDGERRASLGRRCVAWGMLYLYAETPRAVSDYEDQRDCMMEGFCAGWDDRRDRDG